MLEVAVLQFARRLLSGTYSGLKGAPEELAKAKKVLLLCEQKGTDAININYEPGEAGEHQHTLERKASQHSLAVVQNAVHLQQEFTSTRFRSSGIRLTGVSYQDGANR